MHKQMVYLQKNLRKVYDRDLKKKEGEENMQCDIDKKFNVSPWPLNFFT